MLSKWGRAFLTGGFFLTSFCFGSMEAPTPKGGPVTLGPVNVYGSTPTPLPAGTMESQLASDLSTVGKMKDHFRIGMSFFLKDRWGQAIPELMASTMAIDPRVWDYFYAEAYATLGVIYEFHNRQPDHFLLAFQYYKRALKYDPGTFSARYYIKTVVPKDSHSL